MIEYLQIIIVAVQHLEVGMQKYARKRPILNKRSIKQYMHDAAYSDGKA